MDVPGTTWIGPFEPQPATGDEVARLAGALTRGGMETLALEDARGAQWTKLIFNSATNPLAALTGLTHGRCASCRGCARWRARWSIEGRAVADALGIVLDGDPDALISQEAERNHDHKPSMLQDVLARRPTEIDVLNGGIVEAGAQCGVPTPLHAAITALVMGLEAGDGRREDHPAQRRRAAHPRGGAPQPAGSPPGFIDDDGLMAVNFGGFLVRTPEHVVVVDTGIGAGALPELPIGTFPDGSPRRASQPEDVDTVIFTHLHFDHVGWATDGETPLFTRARTTRTRSTGRTGSPTPHAETGPGREDFGAIPAPERLAPLADSIVLHEGERPRSSRA